MAKAPDKRPPIRILTDAEWSKLDRLGEEWHRLHAERIEDKRPPQHVSELRKK